MQNCLQILCYFVRHCLMSSKTNRNIVEHLSKIYTKTNPNQHKYVNGVLSAANLVKVGSGALQVE